MKLQILVEIGKASSYVTIDMENVLGAVGHDGTISGSSNYVPN